MQYSLGYYYRLSDDDRDKSDESNSIKNQRLFLKYFVENMAEFQGAAVREFVDDGYTGTNFNRPGFQEMITAVQNKEINCILVKDLSRLGRDTIETQDYVEKIFPFWQVRFLAVNDCYDSNEPIKNRKDMELKFKNLINGIYPKICSDNIKQVLRKRAEEGKHFGSTPPYGYCFKEGDRASLYLDKEAADVVKRIFRLRLEGQGAVKIAKRLNIDGVETPSAYLSRRGYKLQVSDKWNAGNIKRMLRNPVYTGTMVNGMTEVKVISTKISKMNPRERWICVENMHEPIISKETFEAVSAIREKYRGKTPADSKIKKHRMY